MNLALNYVQIECAEEREVTQELVKLSADMIEWAKARADVHGDCVAMAAPQFGVARRVCVVCDDKGVWTPCLNLFITETKGDAVEKPLRVLNFITQLWLLDIYTNVTIAYEHLLTRELVEKDVVPPQSTFWQGMAALLNGEELKLVDKDFYTIKGSSKISRNAPCPCGSGRKYKKCCEGGVRNGVSHTQPEALRAVPTLPHLREEKR